jgi:hypothetical protein
MESGCFFNILYTYEVGDTLFNKYGTNIDHPNLCIETETPIKVTGCRDSRSSYYIMGEYIMVPGIKGPRIGDGMVHWHGENLSLKRMSRAVGEVYIEKSGI